MHQLDLQLVYVIEDDSITAAITKTLVKKSLPDAQVQLYANGQQALQQLKVVLQEGLDLPGLILLDLNMPLMDGWEFLDAFASLALSCPICVLLLTSSINPEDRAKAARYQTVAGYFSKPLNRTMLAQILRLRREACRPSNMALNVPGELHCLVYQSYATVPFGDLQLAKLLAQSRAFNAAHGLTGVLLYNHGNIIQVLEGNEAIVRTVFTRIARDPRHSEVIKLADGSATHRLFTQWSMGFHTINPAAFSNLTGYINPAQKNYLSHGLDAANSELHALLTSFVSDDSLHKLIL